MKTTEAIILDLGGVIINLDYRLTENAFKALGIVNFNLIYTQAKQTNVFDLLETGKLEEKAFYTQIKRISGIETLKDNEIRDAWNAMLLDFPPERIETIKKLKSRYKLFLLSNTNQIHINAFYNILDSSIGVAKFESIFDKVYYSSQIGMRKPDEEIFNFVLNQNILDPSKTIFIDDSLQHIEGARRVGINAHLLSKGTEILKLLADLKLMK